MAHTSLQFSPPFAARFGYPKKTPSFSTIVQTPVSRRGEVRTGLQPYPIWKWDWSIESLRGSEQDQGSDLQYVLGFFLAMGGMLSDFLYQDPYDNQVSGQFFGIGDGTTTQFQLLRSIGIGSDIVQNLNGTPVIRIAGGQTLAFTLGSTGIVTFTTAPPAGLALTWSGAFFYRTRFDTDEQDFEEFMRKIWESGSLKLRSVIL
jgi:hypothetical protein